jgi:hypothetical protein
MGAAPNDFSNMTGLFIQAARELLQEKGSPIEKASTSRPPPTASS